MDQIPWGVSGESAARMARCLGFSVDEKWIEMDGALMLVRLWAGGGREVSRQGSSIRQRVLAMVGRKQDSGYGLTSLSPAGNACQYQCARVTSAIPLLVRAKWIMPERGLTQGSGHFKPRLNFWQQTPPENVKPTPNITINSQCLESPPF